LFLFFPLHRQAWRIDARRRGCATTMKKALHSTVAVGVLQRVHGGLAYRGVASSEWALVAQVSGGKMIAARHRS
jgi:hypothetical protein